MSEKTLPEISAKLARAMKRFCATDNHRAVIQSIGVGKHSLVATDTHILAVVGEVEEGEAYRATNVLDLSAQIALAEIYGRTVDFGQAGDTPIPPQGKATPYPKAGNVVPKFEGVHIAVNPKRLKKLCDLAIATGSIRMLIQVPESPTRPVRVDTCLEEDDAINATMVIMPMAVPDEKTLARFK